MPRFTRSLMQLCLAGTGLATAALCTPAAQAAVYTKTDVAGVAAVSAPVHFDVYLPLRNTDKLDALLEALQNPMSGQYHKWLTPSQFATQFGPSAATKASLARELAAQGFQVKVQSRSIHVDGTVDSVNRAFGTSLTMVRDANGHTHTVSLTALKLSPQMIAAGAVVPAFSAHQINYHVDSSSVGKVNPDNRYGPYGGYWYNDLREAYAYPAFNATVTSTASAPIPNTTLPYNGAGASIGALMSSDMQDADVLAMFVHEGYSSVSHQYVPLPNHIYLEGTQANVLTGAFDEASLDIEQELGGAPGANVFLFDIPDLSDASVLGGYTAIDEYNVTDVVSSSFGGCELFDTPAYNGGMDYTYVLKLEDQLFAQGNAQGITFVASSGDSAGKECTPLAYLYGEKGTAFIPGIEAPADSPHVTAVGGTNLVTSLPTAARPFKSTYVTENAFSDPEVPYDPYGVGVNVRGGVWGAGGGESQVFPMPTYQTKIKTSGITGRMVPDIGMQVGGCPGGISKLDPNGECDGQDKAIDGNGNIARSYVIVAVGGSYEGLIGTSVSSPEFASAMALLVERVGRVGNINPYLYSQAATQYSNGPTQFDVYHTGIRGYNGVVTNKAIAPNYNYTTGVGTTIVNTLIGAPYGTPLAGDPRTPSNP